LYTYPTLHDRRHSYPSSFCTDTPTTNISPLSLPDALPISIALLLVIVAFSYLQTIREYPAEARLPARCATRTPARLLRLRPAPRSESTRLNSSHVKISYAVFCLKKKKRTRKISKYSIISKT